MMQKYKGIDLFCGIGGFRLAMKSNNVKCVFSSDNDKFAQQTYEANFHEIPTGDIKTVEAKDIPHFDILTAGFPCQPFSYAGEKQALMMKLKVKSLMFNANYTKLIFDMSRCRPNRTLISKIVKELIGWQPKAV